MAGFQTASLMTPDHPMLYGTTLAISLVSVAALSSGGILVPVARVEYALGLTDNASATVTTAPVMNAAEQEAIDASVVPDRVDAPAVEAPKRSVSVPAERQPNLMPVGLEAAHRVAVPKIVKVVLAATLQPERPTAPQAISAPAIAELPQPKQEASVAALPEADSAPQPSQSFVGAFESIPNPSLAVAAVRQDEVRDDGSAVSHATALAAIAAKPDQELADQHKVALAPVPVVSPAIVQTLAPAMETAPGVDRATSKLTATTAPLPVKPSIPQAVVKPAPAAQPLRLINSPQLRRFDLARIHVPPRTPTALLSPANAKLGQASKVHITGAKDKLVGGVVFHRVTVSVSGSSPKPLDVRIGADMKPSIKVGDLLELVSGRMDTASVNRFASAVSAEEYVSLAALRASGFNVSYHAATDSISINAAD